MTDNIFAFGTGRPLAQEKQEVEEMEKKHEEAVERQKSENADRMVYLLTSITKLVAEGRVDSLAIVARDSEKGVFMSELTIADSSKVDTFHAFAGKLEAMKLEAVDRALSGPEMLPDGNLVAFGVMTDPDEYEEEFDDDV